MSLITTCYDNGICGTFAKDPPTQVETPFAGEAAAQTPATEAHPTAASKSSHEQQGGKPAPTNVGKPQQTDDGKPAPASTRKTHTQISSTPLATNVNSDPTSVSDNASKTETPIAAPASVDGGSGGVSKGAAAGIAIATALLGGAIAFVIAFMLFKRRGRKTSRKYSDSSTAFITPKTEHPAYVQVSQTVPPATNAAAAHARKESLDLSNLSNSSDFLAGVLSPGADEQTVKNRVTALLNQIQQHIDEFYRDAQVTLTPTMEKDLKRFSGASVDLVDQLKQHMPTIALKHALTCYILGIVAPEADQQSTLFPIEVAGLKENERSIGSQDDQAAYILYKRLAIHLHAPPPASLHSRQSDIHEAAEHFALTFFPWANPIYADKDKDENLVEVVNHALDLSMWLFGQPYLYEWLWEEVGRRGTVIAPGLMRTTDEKGRVLERPVRITEVVVAMS